MNNEIERKFKVKEDSWREKVFKTSNRYSQGYIATSKNVSVRIRVSNTIAEITIKDETPTFSRAEFEYEIPLEHGHALLALCDGGVISKVKHYVYDEGSVWEVHEYFDDFEGLVLAEIELLTETQETALPSWIGEEVTHDRQYKNMNIAAGRFAFNG